MKELISLSISFNFDNLSYMVMQREPTLEGVRHLRGHMMATYPNPRYVLFSASVYDADGEEGSKLLTPTFDENEMSLEDFWDEVQEMLS